MSSPANSRPYILLTNDDGIRAEGIRALAGALAPVADLLIVAPSSECSGQGHAISVLRDMRLEPYENGDDFKGWSLCGTPADCVYLAREKLLPRTPDLILSGINNGPNLGQQDVAYSGTVAGAVQGTFFGVPSMAVSCLSDSDRRFDFDYAAGLAVRLAEYFLGKTLPRGITLNVNIPPAPCRGLRITKLGQKCYSPEIIEALDPRRLPYFWIGLGRPVPMGDGDSDIEAAKQGYVSLTPLHSDLTSYEMIRHPLLSRLAGEFKQDSLLRS
jgi:5'-nucleotidase